MRPFALLLLLIILASAGVDAQKRPAGGVPILVDVISGSVEPSALTRPQKSRELVSAPASPAVVDLERHVFAMINEARAASGMRPYEWNDEIAQLARVHSQNMAEYRFFSHKDLDGMTVDGRAESYGITGWRGIGENIATMQGQSDPAAAAIRTWMQSPGHRQNILSGMWTQSAVGIGIAKDGTYYFTQVFVLR